MICVASLYPFPALEILHQACQSQRSIVGVRGITISSSKKGWPLLQVRLETASIAFNAGVLAQLTNHRGTKYAHGDRALIALATTLRQSVRQLLKRASDPLLGERFGKAINVPAARHMSDKPVSVIYQRFSQRNLFIVNVFAVVKLHLIPTFISSNRRTVWY